MQHDVIEFADVLTTVLVTCSRLHTFKMGFSKQQALKREKQKIPHLKFCFPNFMTKKISVFVTVFSEYCLSVLFTSVKISAEDI